MGCVGGLVGAAFVRLNMRVCSSEWSQTLLWEWILRRAAEILVHAGDGGASAGRLDGYHQLPLGVHKATGEPGDPLALPQL